MKIDKYLEDSLIYYAIKLIEKEVSPSEYHKEDLINEIRTYGVDNYGDLTEDGDWKLIDELQSEIDDTIRRWCKNYEKEFDKETILKIPLQKLSKADRNTYLNIVPDDFPECNDYKADYFLGLLKINVEDFIKLNFDEICKLPLCSPQLKEEKKEERYLKVLEYQQNIINYINDLESEVN